jgi:protein phosphatase methylesterase 1
MSDLHKKLMLGNSPALRLPPRIPLSVSHSSGGGLAASIAKKKAPKDYTVLPWTNYYDTHKDVVLENENKFRVYIKGDSGPVFFFLHGGGFSGLSWALLSSSLARKIKCQCYSLDIRGHGIFTSHSRANDILNYD